MGHEEAPEMCGRLMRKRAQFGWRTGVAVVAMAVAGLLPAAARAAEIAINCPATEIYAELKLQLSGATLTVTEADGVAQLPATLNGDAAGMFTVAAAGTMDGVLPVLADLETCVTAKLAQQGAAASDTDALAFGLNQCRVKLTAAAVRQKLDASLVVTSLDPGSASLLISRRYIAPSGLSGAPLQLVVWPMRQCSVVAAP